MRPDFMDCEARQPRSLAASQSRSLVRWAKGFFFFFPEAAHGLL
jgi:hypothetical protein